MNKVVKYAIEIVVIIAVGLAVLFGLSKISPNLLGIDESQTQDEMAYEKKQVLVTYEITQKKHDILSKIGVGDLLFDYYKKNTLGEIVSVSEIEPSRALAKDYKTNSYILTPMDDFYDRDIVVSVEADVSEKYIMAGSTDLKIGYTVSLISEEYFVTGVVTKIEILDNEAEVISND